MPLTIAITQKNEDYKALILNNSEQEEADLTTSILNNIYFGKVVSIESDSDFAVIALENGLEGHLPLKNIGPSYTRLHPVRKGQYRRDISTILWPDQEVLVQVVNLKPVILTTDLTIPGHFLVFTPYNHRIHISKKIEDNEERERLMSLVKLLDIPQGFGFIVRTDSIGASYEDFNADYLYLEKSWLQMVKKLNDAKSPSLIREQHPVEHLIVEHMNTDCTNIWLEDEDDLKRAKSVMEIYRPDKVSLLKLHTEETPLLEKFKN